jgi:hypothetical protein
LAFTGANTAIAVGMVTIALILLFFAIEWVEEKSILSVPRRQQLSWNYAALTTVVLFQAILMFGVLRASAFIYFQF